MNMVFAGQSGFNVLPPVAVNSLNEAWPMLRRLIRTRLRRGYRVVEVGVEAA